MTYGGLMGLEIPAHWKQSRCLSNLVEAMANKRDRMKLWRDSDLPDGMELLRASCFDHRYPAHFHGEFVIAAFARGAQRYRISKYEGIAEAGTLMIIPPGEVHTGEAVERDLGWDYCAFYPSARFLERIADDVLGGHGAVEFGREKLRADRTIADLLLRAIAAISATPDVLERECAAYEAFGAVIARYGQRAGPCSSPSRLGADMRSAIAFLEARFDQQVTISEVASVVGLSDYHFMRTFRAKTGLSVHRYLTQIRVNRAKALLARGTSAAETALSVGFFDQSHLIRQFHAFLGVTPGAYAAASGRRWPPVETAAGRPSVLTSPTSRSDQIRSKDRIS
jgi:AraC-like DNA-binding protein